MTRTSLRPAAALLLAAGLVAYVGCNSGKDSSGNAPPLNISAPLVRADAKSTSEVSVSSNPNKLFADWPPGVLAALVISGEQAGYLEPCGCTSGQLGGLIRRYDLLDRMRNQLKWPMVAIDLGTLIHDPASARGGLEQSKAKFSIALQALSLMKYDALALSAEDLKLDVGEAVGQFLNLGEKPKVVVANVKPVQAGEKNIVPSVKVKAGPVSIGITAVLDPEALNRLKDDAKDVFLPTVEAPEKALPEVLADLEKSTDTQVLMVQGPVEMARSLAAKFPGFDIVVGTSQFDPDAQPESLNNGKTQLICVGTKGKFVGVVGFFDDPKQRTRYQRQSLNNRFDGDAREMRELVEDKLQQELKDRGVVENFPRRNVIGSSGEQFVGAETCKECHPGTYAKWASTKHARAFDDIVKDPHNEKRADHQFDAECVSCHTTGFEYNSGWMSAQATPYLKGNQCENCHGPGSKHVEKPDDKEVREKIARTVASVEKNNFCIRCHDEDNSRNFNFAKYWGNVVHNDLDNYDNPKVHEGFQVQNGKRVAK